MFILSTLTFVEVDIYEICRKIFFVLFNCLLRTALKAPVQLTNRQKLRLISTTDVQGSSAVTRYYELSR